MELMWRQRRPHWSARLHSYRVWSLEIAIKSFGWSVRKERRSSSLCVKSGAWSADATLARSCLHGIKGGSGPATVPTPRTFGGSLHTRPPQSSVASAGAASPMTSYHQLRALGSEQSIPSDANIHRQAACDGPRHTAPRSQCGGAPGARVLLHGGVLSSRAVIQESTKPIGAGAGGLSRVSIDSF